MTRTELEDCCFVTFNTEFCHAASSAFVSVNEELTLNMITSKLFASPRLYLVWE